MEDGREIFDDDLDDDVVESKKGKHSHNFNSARRTLNVKSLSENSNYTKSFCAGKAGAKAADAKKNVKKSVVAKPNTIKSLFMNSNVKRPAEVCFCCHYWVTMVFDFLKNTSLS